MVCPKVAGARKSGLKMASPKRECKVRFMETPCEVPLSWRVEFGYWCAGDGCESFVTSKVTAVAEWLLDLWN